MDIGGIDVILRARSDLPVVELILSRVKELWPAGVLENAGDDLTFPLSHQALWLSATQSTEFFIYRDQDSADAWEREGGTDANQSTMLHFLIGGDASSGEEHREVTVVYGEPRPEFEQLVRDLELALAGAADPSSCAR